MTRHVTEKVQRNRKIVTVPIQGHNRIDSGSKGKKQWRRDKIVNSGVDMTYVHKYISTLEEMETKT